MSNAQNANNFDIILNRLILAGGPPRSGTTLLAKILNSHSNIVTSIDNGNWETRALYYYREESGLVRQLREGDASPENIRQYLEDRFIENDQVIGVAFSPKVSLSPVMPSIQTSPEKVSLHSKIENKKNKSLVKRIRKGLKRFLKKQNLSSPSAQSSFLDRRRVSMQRFQNDLSLCLKSPEITFVLPQLSRVLPDTRFILVYRPVFEIAESMYRKGLQWNFSYHKRWRAELDAKGNSIPPLGVPDDWHYLWQTASDFQRCVIYAASYIRAMATGIPFINPRQLFIYDHCTLQKTPQIVLHALASFLNIDENKFGRYASIRREGPAIDNTFMHQYHIIQQPLELDHWLGKLHKASGAFQAAK
jgi:hypothetical protein